MDHGWNTADHGWNTAEHGRNTVDHSRNVADHSWNTADQGWNTMDHSWNTADQGPCSGCGPPWSICGPLCSGRGPRCSGRGPLCSGFGPACSSRGPPCSGQGTSQPVLACGRSSAFPPVPTIVLGLLRLCFDCGSFSTPVFQPWSCSPRPCVFRPLFRRGHGLPRFGYGHGSARVRCCPSFAWPRLSHGRRARDSLSSFELVVHG